MISLVNKKAEDFTCTAYYKKGFKQISLSDYTNQGKFVLLFFYPFDFTFVCPTEIINFSEISPEFEKNNCAVLGCSIDSHFVHSRWDNTEKNKGGLGGIQIPLLSDINKNIATKFNALIEDGDAKGATYRTTVIIDAKGVIRYYQNQDLCIGRNVDELLRVVQAIQFSDEHGEVCPAKWKPGKKGMKTNQESLVQHLTTADQK